MAGGGGRNAQKKRPLAPAAAALDADQSAPPSLRRLRSCRGFTLIEIIVVLVIISVIIAVVVPRFGSSWKQVQDNDFLDRFTQTIERARLSAMNSGRPAAFRLNGAARVYGCGDPPRRPIPLNVEIFSEHLQQDPGTGDFLIIFYPDGSLVGNGFEVTFDHRRTYRVYIDPLFGTVSFKRVG